ncbi:hypothetical protein JTB14_019726 [Gonioctena quinquepunctata]|nr:hypothetical protein JTB14_019726 [Gonioctena quinquepunctata]
MNLSESEVKKRGDDTPFITVTRKKANKAEKIHHQLHRRPPNRLHRPPNRPHKLLGKLRKTNDPERPQQVANSFIRIHKEEDTQPKN